MYQERRTGLYYVREWLDTLKRRVAIVKNGRVDREAGKWLGAVAGFISYNMFRLEVRIAQQHNLGWPGQCRENCIEPSVTTSRRAGCARYRGPESMLSLGVQAIRAFGSGSNPVKYSFS